MEWKNTPDLFTQYEYLDLIPPTMLKLLTKYTWFFDSDFFYWIPKKRNGCQSKDIVKRRPLIYYPQKSTPTEKRKPYTKSKQTKINYFLTSTSNPHQHKPHEQAFFLPSSKHT